MLCRHHEAEPAELPHLAQYFTRRAAGVVPCQGIRLDFPFDEARHLSAQIDVLGALVHACHHRGRDSDSSGRYGDYDYMRNTPKVVSGIGAFSEADSASASVSRVSSGSMTPSSHRRAVA